MSFDILFEFFAFAFAFKRNIIITCMFVPKYCYLGINHLRALLCENFLLYCFFAKMNSELYLRSVDEPRLLTRCLLSETGMFAVVCGACGGVFLQWGE